MSLARSRSLDSKSVGLVVLDRENDDIVQEESLLGGDGQRPPSRIHYERLPIDCDLHDVGLRRRGEDDLLRLFLVMDGRCSGDNSYYRLDWDRGGVVELKQQAVDRTFGDVNVEDDLLLDGGEDRISAPTEVGELLGIHGKAHGPVVLRVTVFCLILKDSFRLLEHKEAVPGCAKE